MAQKHEQHDETIDLGTASVETFGTPSGIQDELGNVAPAGLSND